MLANIAEATIGYLIGVTIIRLLLTFLRKQEDKKYLKAELARVNAERVEEGLSTFPTIEAYDQYVKDEFTRKLDMLYAQEEDAVEDAAIAAAAAAKKAIRSEAGKKAAATRKANAEAAALANKKRTKK